MLLKITSNLEWLLLQFSFEQTTAWLNSLPFVFKKVLIMVVMVGIGTAKLTWGKVTLLESCMLHTTTPTTCTPVIEEHKHKYLHIILNVSTRRICPLIHLSVYTKEFSVMWTYSKASPGTNQTLHLLLHFIQQGHGKKKRKYCDSRKVQVTLFWISFHVLLGYNMYRKNYLVVEDTRTEYCKVGIRMKHNLCQVFIFLRNLFPKWGCIL